MVQICEGLNVLEIGSASIATSIAGMVLADAGARVVKVEPPEGDRLRTVNPNGFRIWNRGKESVVIDLRTADGQHRFREFAVGADVVIEGFHPKRTDEWGIGGDALRAADPRLVHCSITAFGRHGPYSGVKGYDPLVLAKAGVWARGAFGHRDGPIMYPMHWASFGAAMQSVAGILGALSVRHRTGDGQRVDATMYAGLEPLDYFVSTIAQLTAKSDPPPGGSAHGMVTTRYGVLVATRDGRFIQTSTLLPHQGKALCEVAGVGHVLEEPRFSRLPMFDSPEDAQDWEDLLLEAFRREDLNHWMPLLLASPDIAFEVAVTSEEGIEHPQFVHNGDVVTIEDPVVGPIRQVGPLAHFASSAMAPSRSAPALGDHEGPLASSSPEDGAAAVPAHPYAGVTIVEFGYFYAMPYALTMMAALGARVIKIEDGRGDPHRSSFGEEVASNKTTAGKESVSLDLTTDAGRAIAREIVRNADAFVTGFRSGIADKLGLGEADLRAVNPRLLYVHAAGYGTDGPFAGRALYAQAAQAIAGSFGRQVGYWAAPEQNIDLSVLEMQVIVLPRLAQVIDGDSNASLALLAALALGLYHQGRTGEGQFVRTSMIAGNALAYSDDFCHYEGKVPVPLCDDEYLGTSALNGLYRAAEGSWVCLVVQTDEEFARLVDEVDADLDDPRFGTAMSRADHDAGLRSALEAAFVCRDAGAWEAALGARGVGCVEVNLQGLPAFTAFDSGLRESGLTVAYEHPLFGGMVRAAAPVEFSTTPGRIGPPCLRGQDNRRILAEVGYSEADIDRFESDGVLVPPARTV